MRVRGGVSVRLSVRERRMTGEGRRERQRGNRGGENDKGIKREMGERVIKIGLGEEESG